jgi:hypothetical protein
VEGRGQFKSRKQASSLLIIGPARLDQPKNQQFNLEFCNEVLSFEPLYTKIHLLTNFVSKTASFMQTLFHTTIFT